MIHCVNDPICVGVALQSIVGVSEIVAVAVFVGAYSAHGIRAGVILTSALGSDVLDAGG